MRLNLFMMLLYDLDENRNHFGIVHYQMTYR